MTTIQEPSPSIDVTDVTDVTALHIIALSIEPITDRMRCDPLAHVLPLARFALVAHGHEGHQHLLRTDADPGVGNLVHLGRSVACAEHITFVEPANTCRYCGSPTAAAVDYCPGRNCEHLDGTREAGWWRDYRGSTNLAAPHAGLVA